MGGYLLNDVCYYLVMYIVDDDILKVIDLILDMFLNGFWFLVYYISEERLNVI